MTGERLRALILDDGRLGEVRTALRDLGVAFLEAESGAEPLPEDGEFALLVTTPARARTLPRGPAAPRHHLHLVVADRDGRAIEGVRCDFLMQRPVCPEVLRLLLERADYEGPERRRVKRVAIGIPIRLHQDGHTRDLVMVQLSAGGCGLVSARPLDPGASVRVELAADLTHPRRLELRGRVLGSRSVRTADGENFDVSIAFEPLSLGDRVTLRALMAGQPLDFHPGRATRAAGDAPRRGTLRRAVAGHSGAARVVIGRDLTPDGLHLERDPTLEAGLRLELAIHAGGGDGPIPVGGVVEADDGDEGWRLAFVDLAPEAKARLEARCRALPRGCEAAGFVIAEILEA